MKYWIYKCNSQNRPHQVAYGDWNDFFLENATGQWGSTEWCRSDLLNAKRGDTILAYQSNRNELVGIVKVTRWESRGDYRDLILKPLRRIGVKVKPLKESDHRIAAIAALKPGRIQTLYPIDRSDAYQLLRAAGVNIRLEHDAARAEITAAKNGGGFGSFEQNKETENAGIKHATKHLRSLGWQVRNISRKNLGYDLSCRKKKSVLHVEVKGIAGSKRRFVITPGERQQWSTDKAFALALVTNARKTKPTLDLYRGAKSIGLFQFEPLSFMAVG